MALARAVSNPSMNRSRKVIELRRKGNQYSTVHYITLRSLLLLDVTSFLSIPIPPPLICPSLRFICLCILRSLFLKKTLWSRKSEQSYFKLDAHYGRNCPRVRCCGLGNRYPRSLAIYICACTYSCFKASPNAFFRGMKRLTWKMSIIR